MQATKIINNVDRFTNYFTKYGRNKNNLLNDLKNAGYNEFRERTLKDKSQVLLAYKDNQPLASYAFRLFPNLSMIQKSTSSTKILSFIKINLKRITKLFVNEKGEEVKEYSKNLRYENNRLSETHEEFMITKKISTLKK